MADRPVRGLQTPAGGYRRPVTDTLVDGLVDSLVTLPGVPVRLYIADDVYTLWSRTPDALPFWAFAWPGGQALVWGAGRTVYTLVGDVPSDELVRVALSVPVHRTSSVAHRLRQACRSLVETRARCDYDARTGSVPNLH